MQQNPLIKCSNCLKSVDVEKCGGFQSSNPVFKYFQCNLCKKSTYTVKCVCKNVVTRQTPFYFGERISCHHCQRAFNIVPCPVCKQMNLWSGDYYMGAYINCFQCKSLTFQHLACPFCQEPNFWITNKALLSYYKCGLPVQCYVCQQKFQHLMCPHCNEAIYFKGSDYLQGIKQTCGKCNKAFQHVNCPGCGDPTYYKENEFLYGKNYKCNECKTNFCLSICDRCGGLNTLCNKITEVNASNFECGTCKNKYNLLCCPLCKGPNYPITEKGKCSNNLCLYCKNVFKVFDCHNCNHISCCSCGTVMNDISKHKCGYCKFEIDNKDNNNTKVKQQNKPNAMLTSSMKGATRIGEDDKDKFICKICYDKPVDTVFLNCGHVCACFSCASALKKKECPICRVEGDYKKCFF